ncbi:MAG TPA: cytochrome c-type biogenesis protein CcmH [Candidatus Acidoferrales bacterium]|nr:cytochrome c-type biogenesis protein CcmH [Candidatus Acidoferrales bacterium]
MARQTKRITWLYAALLAAGLVVFAAPGGAQIPGQGERSQKLGKRLMCMCGCNQILVECNHVGCSMSTAMLKELDARLARNEPEDLVLQSFVQQYGEKVLAQPPMKNFSLVAWVMPFFALLVGFLIIRFLLLRWRHQTPAVAGIPSSGPDIPPEMLERARRDMALEDEIEEADGKSGKD